MPLETIHIIIGIGTMGVTAFLAYIGLKIKLEVANGKTELVHSQEKIAAALDTHVQLDNVYHIAVDKHLEATDGRVDRLEDNKLRNRY